MTRPTFELSSNTRLLRQRLAKASIGEIISYDDLSAVVSRPLAEIRGALATAVHGLLRDDRIRFGCIRGEGLKRLNDTEIVAGADQDIDGIRRRAKKSALKITSVRDFSALSTKDQLAHTVRTSIFSAIASMASNKGIKKVEAAVGGRASELPIAQTLRAFLPAT